MVMSSKAVEIQSMTNDMRVNNNYTLQAGDLILYAGHIGIYVGNGVVMDSHGGKGREPGNAIGTYDAANFYQKGKNAKGKAFYLKVN
jgi:cell wall-associated NlpC family hydrolase